MARSFPQQLLVVNDINAATRVIGARWRSVKLAEAAAPAEPIMANLAPGNRRSASHDGSLLQEAVRRLVEALAPERIYLFGSRARGDAREDSDYDLLIVVKHRTGPGYHSEQVAYDSLWGLGMAKDIVIFTREQFDRQRPVVASLPATAEREGRLLYAA